MPATRGLATLERNTAVSTPTGTPMTMAPRVPQILVRMKGRMPKLGSAAVDFHTVPSKNSPRPISLMAGRPAVMM